MEWNDIFISTVLWISLRCECIMESFWAWHRCLLIPELPAFVKAEFNKYQERKIMKMAYPQKYINNKDSDQEQASMSGPKGSMTVEASLTIPIFLFAVLCLIYLLEVQAIRISVHSAAQGAAKNAAEDIVTLPVLNLFKLKSDMVKLIGPERLEGGIIEGGKSGISCLGSIYYPSTGEIHIRVSYKIKMPFPGFMHLGIRQRDTFIVKAWTGYKKPDVEDEDGQIVYVTDTGTVYHTNYQCSYLQLSIRFLASSGLSGIRNLGGGRYRSCEKCVQGRAMAGVYVTDSGNRYHNSLNCSGLKRSIRAVKKSKAYGKGPCNRCGTAAAE